MSERPALISISLGTGRCLKNGFQGSGRMVDVLDGFGAQDREGILEALNPKPWILEAFPRALRTHISRLLGPKTIQKKALGLF